MPALTIIGLGNMTPPQLSSEARDHIATGKSFAGGKRHYALVRELLPSGHTWLNITKDIPTLLTNIAKAPPPRVIFASGDPLFYGLASSIRTQYPDWPLTTIPHTSSLHLLAHKTQTPHHHMQVVSLHGRDWHQLDVALLRQAPLIGVLTDAYHSPEHVAARLLEYGFDNYDMTTGEALESREERIRHQSLAEVSTSTYAALNCVLLARRQLLDLPLGIPDEAFIPLPGRPNMITKWPYRLLALQALGLHRAEYLWDIGACTGSVGIEARRLYPQVRVTAFEKRLECEAVLTGNARALHTPITPIIADVLSLDLSQFPTPQAVFIGGHGGQLAALLQAVNIQLRPQAHIVMNSVQQSSVTTFCDTLAPLGYHIRHSTHHYNTHNPITLLKAVKP